MAWHSGCTRTVQSGPNSSSGINLRYLWPSPISQPQSQQGPGTRHVCSFDSFTISPPAARTE